MTRLPNVHESSLDFALIDTLGLIAAPYVTQSGYLVDVDVHFLGGGRHWGSWEIADIGVIVTYRQAGALVRTKVALLQCKRLYPREVEFVEDEPISKEFGMGSLFYPGPLPAQAPRKFTFDKTCHYRALQVGDEQWRAIQGYEQNFRIPIHYLLYHPRSIPSSQIVPLNAPYLPTRAKPTVGCRVLRASALQQALGVRARNYAPSYTDLVGLGIDGDRRVGWRLEEFMADHVLSCREGYISDHPTSDEGLDRVFNRRGAPISAAIRVSIDAPENINDN